MLVIRLFPLQLVRNTKKENVPHRIFRDGLLYLPRVTQPDIFIVVSILAWYLSGPKPALLQKIKQLAPYLMDTGDYSLMIPRKAVPAVTLRRGAVGIRRKTKNVAGHDHGL